MAFDEQIFLFQKHGGVSRYFVNLINQLQGDQGLGVTPDLPFRRVWNDYAVADLAGFGVRRGPSLAAPYPLLAAAWARPRRRGAVDIVHHTFYHRRFLRDFPKAKRVSTIHDMIPELFPQAVPGNVHMAKKEYYQRSDLILVGSESARRDLVEQYGEPQAPMVVTHHGVDESFAAGGPPVAGFPREYLLYVGRRDGYKDFDVLLKAFAAIAGSHRELSLVAVGGGPLTVDEESRIHHLGLKGRVTQKHLRNTELPGAYSHARLFVMPSRYEGFGLPVLESMAAGCPAVLADVSSLPEVGGDAAVYFPPGESDSLADTLSTLVTDQKALHDMSNRGRRRAAGFTWHRQAQLTANAYRSLFDGGR